MDCHSCHLRKSPCAQCSPLADVTAEEILGTIDERNAMIPAEKVAINAVMAGCLPAYFPVVLAAVQALCHPDFHYHNPATSTGGSGPLQ